MRGWYGMAKKIGDQYAQLGVVSDKRSVMKIFAKSNRKKVFPHAFCVIHYDKRLKIYYSMHIDGSGSKSVARLLYFLETGEAGILVYDLFDSASMNTSDVAACGFTEVFMLNNVKAINSKSVDKNALLKAIAIAEQELEELYARFGMDLRIEGGETADLPNQTESYILDASVFTYLQNRSRIIQGNVQPGDGIWGLRSDGQGIGEKEYNFGIMSNGLSFAEDVLLHADYSRIYKFLTPTNPFKGKYCIDEFIPSVNATLSKALLSPTRQWPILIKMLLDDLENSGNLYLLHGISMNTGGGATKVRNIGTGICYRKRMPEPPPIFQLLQFESHEQWKNMFTTLNCGIGLDIVGDPKGGILEKAIRKVSQKTNVGWMFLGDCTKSGLSGNTVKLYTQYGDFFYR